MKAYSKYIKDIEESLIKIAPLKTKSQIAKLAGYIGTQHQVLGIETHIVREMAKTTFNVLVPEDWCAIIDELYKRSNFFEAKNTAIYIIDYNFKRIDENKKLELLPLWINHTDNWAHSDYLSKFYTQFLESEKHRKSFLKLISKWNNDNNFWKRRQSLVSLYYYARSKKSFLPYKVTEKLITNLLHDKEYFVQKGLGWTLRESFNVYPRETYDYILNHAADISSTAFSAAVEKMSIKQKEVLKYKRKNSKLKK